jgi:hypothetical protein
MAGDKAVKGYQSFPQTLVDKSADDDAIKSYETDKGGLTVKSTFLNMYFIDFILVSYRIYLNFTLSFWRLVQTCLNS